MRLSKVTPRAVKVKVVGIDEISPELYKKLYRLNLGESGLMRGYLKDAYEQSFARLRSRKGERVIIAQDASGTVLGWVLMLSSRWCTSCVWKDFIHIYIRSKCRGKGLANQLVKLAIDIHKPNKLYCRGNIGFFLQYGITYGR